MSGRIGCRVPVQGERDTQGDPDLPGIEVRLLRAPNPSSLADEPASVLRQETLRRIGPG